MSGLIQDIHEIRYKRSLFTAVDVFASSVIGQPAAMNYYIQVPNNISGKLHEFHTLIIDLSQSEQEIWEQIYHRTREEINSYLHNIDHSYSFILQPTDHELKEMMLLFDEFADSKHIRLSEKERLIAYNKAGVLALSYVKEGPEIMAMNFYRINTQRASNLHSFTCQFKNKGKHSASHFGRVHRALHWLDILSCKKRMVKEYDLCGWYTGQDDQALLNINRFKEQFGGKKKIEYSGVIYHHPLLQLYQRLKG